MSEPIFIKVDDYNALKENIDKLKTKVDDAKSKLQDIKQTRDEEQALFKEWEQMLTALDEKISDAHNAISTE